MDPEEFGWESVIWIRVSEDRDRRRALVKMIMNLKRLGIF
jgi:hypothetical protein